MKFILSSDMKCPKSVFTNYWIEQSSFGWNSIIYCGNSFGSL